VDQRRGLEGLPRLLVSEPLGGQLAEYIIDQRQEPLGRLRVTVPDVREDAGHVIHRRGTARDIDRDGTAGVMRGPSRLTSIHARG
jgi:hypothetical protein